MDARPGWEHPWSPAGLNPLSDALVLTAGTATSGDNVLDAGRWWPRLRLLIMIGPDITQTLWRQGPRVWFGGPEPDSSSNIGRPTWQTHLIRRGAGGAPTRGGLRIGEVPDQARSHRRHPDQ